MSEALRFYPFTEGLGESMCSLDLKPLHSTGLVPQAQSISLNLPNA